MSADLGSESSFNAHVVPSHNPLLGSYQIESVRISKPACIWFARHSFSKDSVVLKLLYAYKDSRYNLESVDDRQRCQLEALKWNRTFTPNIHIGLAHICTFDHERKSFEIDEIIENPSIESLVPNSEYALFKVYPNVKTAFDQN
jgi:hypothetical protein